MVTITVLMVFSDIFGKLNSFVEKFTGEDFTVAYKQALEFCDEKEEQNGWVLVNGIRVESVSMSTLKGE